VNVSSPSQPPKVSAPDEPWNVSPPSPPLTLSTLLYESASPAAATAPAVADAAVTVTPSGREV
jgi:hypothetical protein